MLQTDFEILHQYSACHRLWQGIPSIECTEKGRLFSAFYSGGTTEQLGNYCVLLKSDDGGDTWTLTTYNTAQGGFDGVLREILQKKFSLCPTTGKFEKCQTTNYVISKYFTVVVIIQKSVYNYGVQEKRFRVIKWEQPYFCYFPQNKQRNATHLLSYS